MPVSDLELSYLAPHLPRYLASSFRCLVPQCSVLNILLPAGSTAPTGEVTLLRHPLTQVPRQVRCQRSEKAVPVTKARGIQAVEYHAPKDTRQIIIPPCRQAKSVLAI